MFIFGLDLGQEQDFTALIVIEHSGEEREDRAYDLKYIERFEIGTSYVDIVKRIKKQLDKKEFENAELVIDATGVGRPIVDLFFEYEISPVAITITGGTDVTREGRNYKVPKRDLVSNLVKLFQTDRLKIARDLKHAELLVQELMNFRAKINKKGHDIYEADWREGSHDDLVLATALGCWYAEEIFDTAPLRVRWL